MGLRCKVGDLCIASRPGRTGIVTVVATPGPFDWPGADWLVELPSHPSSARDGLWAAKDSWLTPLRGLPADEHTDTSAPVTV
jgi:hypothetical protein